MTRRDFARTLVAGLAAAPAGRLAAAMAGASGVPQTAAAGRVTRVNGARLNGWLAAIAEFGKNPQGGVTRLAYSDADLAGRKYVIQLMREANLAVLVDQAGNIFGVRGATTARSNAIVFGSHID